MSDSMALATAIVPASLIFTWLYGRWLLANSGKSWRQRFPGTLIAVAICWIGTLLLALLISAVAGEHSLLFP
jgi:uncharacterized BrkB/YihY/UPF0761 family membrane protein